MEQARHNGGDSRFTIFMRPVQQNNPVIKEVRHVRCQVSNTLVPDFDVGAKACILFLSVRFHLQNPKYIVMRIGELGNSYSNRILLLYIDMVSPDEDIILQINCIALRHNLSLLMAFSTVEAARYLESLKMFGDKQPRSIMPRSDSDHQALFNDCMTSIPSINKTDALTLASTFGSMEKVFSASREDLIRCPGLGDIKVLFFFHLNDYGV
eukprot:513864_1